MKVKSMVMEIRPKVRIVFRVPCLGFAHLLGGGGGKRGVGLEPKVLWKRFERRKQRSYQV